MPWQCRLIEYTPTKPLEIGDSFFVNEHLENAQALKHLSPNYLRDWQNKRRPLWVMTPGGCWCVDEKPFVSGKYQESGWTVTGEAPNITCSPSINFPGRYHGYLINGVLSDDLEGRRYP